MARIITYEDDPNISDLDRLIGSDGNDYNITKNFTLLGIAEYVIDVFVNPDATDFHIPVFNQNGTRITDSIMHQDSSPANGVTGTIITVDGNFEVIANTQLGVTVDDITSVPSTLQLRGKVSDKNNNFGVANQLLYADENGYVQWGPECGQGFVLGQGTLYYLPLWTPDSGSIGDSIVYQDGDASTPATKIVVSGDAEMGNLLVGQDATVNGDGQIDGGLTVGLSADITGGLTVGDDALISGSAEVAGTLKIGTVDLDNSLNKILVQDSSGEVHYRDADTIKPKVGFDTLAMTPDGWASSEGYFNAYVSLDDSVTASKNIKDMTWLSDGDRVVVIAENVKPGASGPLADGTIAFPTWSSTAPDGSIVSVESFGSWVGVGANFGYPTATLQFGEKLKFKGEYYYVPGGNAQINWDACCKILSKNVCPVVNPVSFTTLEDTAFTGTLVSSDDGYGSYGVTYSIVSAPSHGTVNLNGATGQYTYTPNANYNGPDQFTYKAYDGYCYSNTATVTITVDKVDEPPIWTSTNPTDPAYTGTPWTNLTGGDVLAPYNWTVDDPDHTCGELSYTATVTDVGTGQPATWLTFTPNTPADCGGTLSGTYPTTGGVFNVSLEVSDPDGNSATQNFQIAGLIPDNDTYLVFWLDGSGSMDDTAEAVSLASSQSQVVSRVHASTSGQSLTLVESPSVTPTNFGYYIDDIDNADKIYGGCWSVTPGMEIWTLASPGATPQNTGRTVLSIDYASSTSTLRALNISSALTVSAGDLLVFRKTAADQSSDYADVNSLRNLLQDFYATGGVEGSPDFNTDPATNGAERFNSHVKFGWMRGDGNGENQIVGMSNYGRQPSSSAWTTALAAGGDFENASTVVSFSFGDEADNWYSGGGLPYTSTTNTNGARMLADIATVQDWLSDGAAAGTQPRCVLMAVSQSDVNDYGTALEIGTSAPNWGSPWTNSTLKITPTTPNPPHAVFLGNQQDTGASTGLTAASPGNCTGPSCVGGEYYKNQIQRALQQLGFTNI